VNSRKSNPDEPVAISARRITAGGTIYHPVTRSTTLLSLGFIGCGTIAGAHLDGLAALEAAEKKRFGLTAVCDIDRDRATRLAGMAAEDLDGDSAPEVYTDYRELLDSGVDAVSVLVPHDLHHVVARDAFEAGVDVQMQKPIAISPRFAMQMLSDAAEFDRTLTVSEPAVLGAGNVATTRAIADGVIGDPYLLVDVGTAATGGGFFFGIPWRHMRGRAGAGWINDHGVHRTHQFTEAFGPVDTVFGRTETFEPVRHGDSVKRETTAEDAASAVLQFENGALGNWVCSTAVHGDAENHVRYYGSEGVLQGGDIVLDDGRIEHSELVEAYAPDVVDHSFAHSYVELAEAIEHGTEPIASSERATDALSVVFAALESATLGRPVSVDAVREGDVQAYEDVVVEEMDDELV